MIRKHEDKKTSLKKRLLRFQAQQLPRRKVRKYLWMTALYGLKAAHI